MILHPRTQQEYDDTLRLLTVINILRGHSATHPPVVADTPWIRTAWPKEVYL